MGCASQAQKSIPNLATKLLLYGAVPLSTGCSGALKTHAPTRGCALALTLQPDAPVLCQAPSSAALPRAAPSHAYRNPDRNAPHGQASALALSSATPLPREQGQIHCSTFIFLMSGKWDATGFPENLTRLLLLAGLLLQECRPLPPAQSSAPGAREIVLHYQSSVDCHCCLSFSLSPSSSWPEPSADTL